MIYKGKKLPIKLQSGDIVMFRNEFEIAHLSTYLSTAIRIATKYPYNHSAVITEGNGQLYINEALGHGIVKRPVDKFLERKTETYIAVLRPKFPVEPTLFSINADRFLGIPYDKNALVVHHLLYRINGKWTGSTNQHAINKLVCSEYVQLTHNRPDFWKASTKEVGNDPFYELIWEEIPLLQK